MRNAKEENAAHTDADTTRPTDHVASDPLEPPRLASRRDDATVWESADPPSSNKTQRRNASKKMVLEDSVTSPLELAHKLFFSNLNIFSILSHLLYIFSLFLHSSGDLEQQYINLSHKILCKRIIFQNMK